MKLLSTFQLATLVATVSISLTIWQANFNLFIAAGGKSHWLSLNAGKATKKIK